MEHVVTAEFAGVVDEVTAEVGATVASGDPLLTIAPSRRFARWSTTTSSARSTPRRCAPISPRCSTGTSAPTIAGGPTPSLGATTRAGAPRGERRGSRRRRIVRRVRTTGRGRAAPSPLARGAHRTHAGRRRRRRRGHGERRPGRGDVVRLHRARRHARAPRPREEGPAVRDRRAPAAAGRLLHRRRRRAPGRHRRDRHLRPRLPRVQLLRAAQRVGAARRHRVGVLLRRERGHPRLLRRRHRRRGHEHRDGRSGDDRRRRPRCVRAHRDRTVRDAGRQRGDRHRGRRRRRRPSRRRSSTSRTSATTSRSGRAATSGGCATSFPRTDRACTTCAR